MNTTSKQDWDPADYYHPELNPVPSAPRPLTLTLTAVIAIALFFILNGSAMWVLSLDLVWGTWAYKTQEFVAGVLLTGGFFSLVMLGGE